MAAEGKRALDTTYPMPDPPGKSTDKPSASTTALWAYIKPAMDHIVRSPTNDPSKAPPIDVAYHMGIHTQTYDYFTSHHVPPNSAPEECETDGARAKRPTSGRDLYGELDNYFAEVAREAFLGSPQDDTALVHYIIPCFRRYSTGAQSVNRLLNYVNRHFVRRAVDEDKGWLRVSDIIQTVAMTAPVEKARDVISKTMKQRKMDELKKWDYVEGGPAALMARAEACAEAASDPCCVVPVSSLALRRFRTEFFEPLLVVPKVKWKNKTKKRTVLPPNGEKPGPKGRLARAVKVLLESEGEGAEEKRKLAEELAKALRTCGIRPDHPLRKKLDKFVAC